jgi:hypothetical protein
MKPGKPGNPRLAVFGIVLSAIAGMTAVSVAAQAPALLGGRITGQSAPKTPARAAAKSFTPARTAWGDPDLQGIYTNKDESGIPFERPVQFDGKTIAEVGDQELAELVRERNQAALERAPGVGGIDTGAGPTHWYENYGAKNSRPWMVVDPPDGRIPPQTAEGRQRAAAANLARRGGNGFDIGPFDGPEDLSLYDRCISRGVPGSMMPAIYGNSYQIIQGPGYVAIRYEMVHEARIIPLGKGPHLGDRFDSYMGDARGHWDGDTLVVETTGFKEASAYRGASRELKLIEHFKPVGPKTVEWSVTLDDPHTWPRPWTFAMNLTLDPSQPIFEYACHEGNYGLRDILSAARASDKAGAKTPNRGRAEE